jgi:RHS repeat-associated protein
MWHDTALGAHAIGDEDTRRYTARLLVRCADRPGIVAAVSGFLFERRANIVASHQYSSDPSGGRFFLRTEFFLPTSSGERTGTETSTRLDAPQLERPFEGDAQRRPRMMVTTQVLRSRSARPARLPGGASYNPIYDAQGDVVGLLNSSGELIQSVRYGPYGENANTTGFSYTPTIDPFLFQGGYQLAGGNSGNGNVPNNLYHYGERYYDPTSGRWTQAEAEGEGYVFGGDDPINTGDPTGENYVYWYTVHDAVNLKIAIEAGIYGAQSSGELGPVAGALGALGAAYLRYYLLPKINQGVETAARHNKETAEHYHGGKVVRIGVTVSSHTLLGGHHHDLPNGVVGVYVRPEGDAPHI